MKTIHFRDIRLFNNAGMSFPLCYADAELLDLDKARLPTSGREGIAEVTCKRCLRMYPKRYSWAVTQDQRELIARRLA
jgi:hypothetical protein